MSVIIKGKNPRKPHTVRYWVDGRQRERSFAAAGEARDFKIKNDHDTRAHIFVDDKLGREDFGRSVDTWISYPVPSSPKRTVPSASLPSRSSMNRVWIFWATGASFPF
jgi:hypothetical protein